MSSSASAVEIFPAEWFLIFPFSMQMILQRIAISPGSGKSEVDNAIEAGAQVLITGDIDHHTGIDAVARGLAIIDAGHYGLEHIYVEYMAHFIQRIAPGLVVKTAPAKEPFWILS